MTKNSIILLGMILFSCYPVAAQENADPNNWGKLNLSSTTIAGTKVYYEKCFEPNLPVFEKMYKDFLAEKNKVQIITSNKEQILAEVNGLLGIEDANTMIQYELFSKFLEGMSSVEIKPLYIVKKDTIKTFIKAGGQLPKISYNDANDYVEFRLNYNRTSKDEGANVFEFVFVIKSSENFTKYIEEQFDSLHLAFCNIYSSAIFHEIAEFSVFMRFKPTDPYLRWFSEGVANALAYKLVAKYLGQKNAEDFIEVFDVNEYKDIKNKISDARYAYATLEVQRLIDEHGIDCIKKILNAISEKKSKTGADLLITIKDVTGEDMFLRLAAYQDFGTKKEGIKKYTERLRKALAEKNYEQAAFNLFRLHDLHFASSDKEFFNDYRNAANCLFMMGLEKEADSIMTQCIKTLSHSNSVEHKNFGLENFVIYAIETKHPEKARDYADELLKTLPDNIAALTVKMMVLALDNQLPQAEDIARKIMSNPKSKETPGYEMASQILGIDPNQIE